MRFLWFWLGFFLFLFYLHLSELNASSKSERWYQKKIAETYFKTGKEEVKLSTGDRVDILTKDYAIEIDFCYKMYEAVGQSLYYALMTERKPGIIIILKKNPPSKTCQHKLNILRRISSYQGIQVWVFVDGILQSALGK